MSISVFISHSTIPKDGVPINICAKPAHAEFLEALCSYLEKIDAPKVTITIDKKILPTKSWRPILFSELFKCQVGIALLNKQAIYYSDWVEKEVSILGGRANIKEQPLPFIIIPLDDVNIGDINKKWEAMALQEIQLLKKDDFDENDPKTFDILFEAIKNILQGIEDYEKPEQGNWLTDRLSHLLPQEIYQLKRIASELHLSYSDADNIVILKRRIAEYLYSKGPTSLCEIVKCSALPQNWNAHDILQILRTYWVDNQATQGILSCLATKDSHRIIAINGKEYLYTPETYVIHICNIADNPWPVITLNIGNSHSNVIEHIREKLVQEFKITLENEEEGFDVIKELNELISTSDSVRVFVTFLQTSGGNVLDIIADIHKIFPHIIIIICTGTQPETSQLPPEIPMLVPELTLEWEQDKFQEYKRGRSHIRNL